MQLPYDYEMPPYMITNPQVYWTAQTDNHKKITIKTLLINFQSKNHPLSRPKFRAKLSTNPAQTFTNITVHSQISHRRHGHIQDGFSESDPKTIRVYCHAWARRTLARARYRFGLITPESRGQAKGCDVIASWWCWVFSMFLMLLVARAADAKSRRSFGNRRFRPSFWMKLFRVRKRNFENCSLFVLGVVCEFHLVRFCIILRVYWTGPQPLLNQNIRCWNNI